MRMTQELKRLEWRGTCGELGALLLESRLVKELSPAHNRRLRASCELYSIRWNPTQGTVAVVDVQEIAGDAYEELSGLFRSKRDAVNALRDVVQANQLCPLVSGLEKGRGPCFASQLKRCRGACCGRETLRSHAARLAVALQALRLEPWPFAPRIGIRERPAGNAHGEVHVFERWCYLGVARDEAELAELAASGRRPVFDLDTHQILSRFIKRKRGNLDIVNLAAQRLAA
jgi:DNA polymerase-3 subunit epsilon